MFKIVLNGAAALTVWLAVGLSLGWYYTFTYFGRTGVPMPTLEPCAALVLYYFSVLNVRTEIQAVHWMVVFPIAGALWAFALQVVAKYMRVAAPAFSTAFFVLACASLPLALPAPFMTWIAGYGSDSGFDFTRMYMVALRRDNQSPWPTLTPTYLVLGFVTLALQLYVYRRLYPAPLKRAVVHYLLSAVVLSAAAAVIGATAAIPLRLLLE